jgi:plasmid stability protein
MVDLLVRRVPETLVGSLKRRASRHRRSLQQELLSILEMAAREPADQSPALVAARIRARLAQAGRTFSNSAILLREDRRR